MNLFFVFSGQGAQAVGMGRDLCEASAAARQVFEQADAALGYELSKICFDGPAEKLTESRYCQPAIYTMSMAALAAFRERHPQLGPMACAGLSLGEYAALACAGAFSFVDGLKLLEQRAIFMDEACKATSGGMASVLGGDAEVIREVAAACDVDVANYNSPGQIVISGEKSKVDAAVAMLKDRGLRKVIPLTVAGAYHSRLMASAGEKLREVIDRVPMQMPEIPVWQNYSGTPALMLGEIRDNLVRQVAGSVRWEECVRGMAEAGGARMIEFGPGAVLTGLLKRTLPEIPGANVNSAASLEEFQL